MEQAMGAELVTLRGAGKSYRGKSVLIGIDVTLRGGEAVALWGANGSGKSTLLCMLAGLSALSEGKRTVGGASPRGPVIGYAPDRLPKLRFECADYVRRLGELRGMPRRTAEARVQELLERFGMAQHAQVQLRHCSKGMLQKVNVMQALLPEPELLLLDEPLSGLDAKTQDELSALMVQLKAEGIALVFATHEPELAAQVADRVLVLQGGGLLADVRVDALGEAARVIDCRWATELSADMAGGAGLLSVQRVTDGMHRYMVTEAEADRWIAALLQAGGSIQRVEQVGVAARLIAALAGESSGLMGVQP
jgi:ABC-2 type transport system ATP-binding protein